MIFFPQLTDMFYQLTVPFPYMVVYVFFCVFFFVLQITFSNSLFSFLSTWGGGSEEAIGYNPLSPGHSYLLGFFQILKWRFHTKRTVRYPKKYTMMKL